MTDDPEKPAETEAPAPPVRPERVEGRTFTLNSREFYEAVCEPRDRPWIPNGSLGREPRERERAVIVEVRKRGTNPTVRGAGRKFHCSGDSK